MKNYTVSVMESHRGTYTGIWQMLSESIKARCTREALRFAAPIAREYDKQGQPEITRPRPRLTVYEYANCKYAVEVQYSE